MTQGDHTYPPYPQVGAGAETPALPAWKPTRVSARFPRSAPCCFRQPPRTVPSRRLLSKVGPRFEGVVNDRIAHTATSRYHSTETSSVRQMACTVPAVRFRIPFDYTDRSQRGSNSWDQRSRSSWWWDSVSRRDSPTRSVVVVGPAPIRGPSHHPPSPDRQCDEQALSHPDRLR